LGSTGQPHSLLGGGNGTFQGAMAAAERFSSLAVVRQDKPVIPEESFEEVQVREGWAKARNERRSFGTMLNEFRTQLADNYLNCSITIMNHCYYFHHYCSIYIYEYV